MQTSTALNARGRTILALVLLTLAVRTGALLVSPDALLADPDGYRRLAENVWRHGTFGQDQQPTAYRPALYPLALVPCVATGVSARPAIGALHVLLGLATVLLTFTLARRLGLGELSFVAAVLVACDPILLAQSTLIMTETLATALVAATLLCLTTACNRPTPSRVALAGALSAATALTRPGLLVWTAAAAVVLPLVVRQTGNRRGRLAVFGCFVLGAAVVLAPWTLRNQARFGRPIVATTHGGYTLLLGNNPWFYEYLRSGEPGSVWDAEELHQSRQPIARGEPAADKAAYKEAAGHIGREPGMFCYSCLVRLGRLWQPLPNRVVPHEDARRRAARYAVGAWYLVEFCLAALGVWIIWREGFPSGGRFGLWAALLVGCLMAVHAFYWTNMRMRAPLVPLIALCATAGMRQSPGGSSKKP